MLVADPVDIDLGRYLDRQEADEARFEFESKQAYENLLAAVNDQEASWMQYRSIGNCHSSPDELLGDCLYEHQDTKIIALYKKLMASEAAKELREAVAAFHADKFREEYTTPKGRYE